MIAMIGREKRCLTCVEKYSSEKNVHNAKKDCKIARTLIFYSIASEIKSLINS